MVPGQVVTRQTIHSGPLPSPEVLEGYKKIKHDAVEIIFDMAQQDQKIRHSVLKTDAETKSQAVNNAHVRQMEQLKLAKVIVYSSLAFCFVFILGGLYLFVAKGDKSGLLLMAPGFLAVCQQVFSSFFKNRK